MGVGRGRGRVGDRTVGHHPGQQAVLLGVFQHRLGRRPVAPAAFAVRPLADHPIVGLHPGHDGAHAVGRVRDEGVDRRGLAQPQMRPLLDVQPQRLAIGHHAGRMDRGHAPGVRQEQDHILRPALALALFDRRTGRRLGRGDGGDGQGGDGRDGHEQVTHRRELPQKADKGRPNAIPVATAGSGEQSAPHLRHVPSDPSA